MIREFRDEYRWLSNFWYMETPIVDDFGYHYPTVEHYYVSQKTNVRIQKYMVSQCPTPGKAKQMGKGFKLPPDWEKKRIDVMYWALVHKFSSKNPWLQQKLIDTGIQQIFEGNNWGDTFWGVDIDTLQGRNMLGCMLMDIRETIQ